MGFFSHSPCLLKKHYKMRTTPSQLRRNKGDAKGMMKDTKGWGGVDSVNLMLIMVYETTNMSRKENMK